MAVSLKASNNGLKVVEEARCKKGWSKTEQTWCDLANTSKSTLRRFWAGLPIRSKTFQEICKAVGIEDWNSILEKDSERKDAEKKAKSCKKRLTLTLDINLDELSKAKLDGIITKLIAMSDDYSLAIIDDHSMAIIGDYSMAKGDNHSMAIIDDYPITKGDDHSIAIIDDYPIAKGDGYSISLTNAQVSEYGIEKIELLLELFYLILDSKGDSHKIIPFLQQNFNVFDDSFAKLLALWIDSIFQCTSPEDSHSIGIAVFIFSNLLQAFHSGNRASNIEIAIAGYHAATKIFTKHHFPEKWAEIQSNLGSSYLERIRGNKSNNIELSIQYYNEALSIYRSSDHPLKWAGTINNLAIAYSNRVKGDRAKNIENAITAYKQALKVMTREAKPIEWASTISNLANAYSERIQGDRAENIEDAITAYEQALQVRTREEMPFEWAATISNLATTYSERIRGDRKKNLKKATTGYESALKVFTRESFPEQWSRIQSVLATTKGL